MFGKLEDRYNSGTSSVSDETEHSGEENSIRHSIGDGRHPQLELLLGHNETQQLEGSQPESLCHEHDGRRVDEGDNSKSVLESLLGTSERQQTDIYSRIKHHDARLVREPTYSKSEQAENSYVASPLSELQKTEPQNTERETTRMQSAEGTQIQNTQFRSTQFRGNSKSRNSPYFEYPVVDMTKAHRIGLPQLHKIRGHSSDLKFEVSHMFNVCSSKVHIIEDRGLKEEVYLKKIIVILPDSVGEEFCPLLIEACETMDQIHSRILCCRLPVSHTIKDMKKLIADELRWRGLVLCENGNVLEEHLTLQSCNFRCLARIQVMKQSFNKIDFVYQPRSDILCSYWLEVDMNTSIKQVKKQFSTKFHDQIQKQKGTKTSSIHFCFQGRLLEDNKCLGLVLRNNIKEENITIHFGSEDSVSIDLKFKVGRKTRHKLLIVSKKISTTSLRTEVSKHLGVDPKAVKLTFEDKLLDEHDDLSRFYGERWRCGCRIAAGIKKQKTLRIKHPTECYEEPFEMYMLDPVSALKRKIAERWGLKLLQIKLFCRGIQMEYDQPLQYYPVKNNMEISLQLFRHRIILKVVILSRKERVSLIIDNSETTTVDDLLRFCAHHFQYARECSRGIFRDQCLDRSCRLADQGIRSGDTVIISYFDQPNLLQGNLINIFMVDENGYMIKRLGAVNSGLLLHAPKTAEAPQTEDTCLDNGPMPEGISICEGMEASVSSLSGQKFKSSLEKEISEKTRQITTSDSMKNKFKFLQKAQRIIQQKYSKPYEQRQKLMKEPKKAQERPAFYIGETKEFELDEETGRKTVVSSKDIDKSDDRKNSNTEIKSMMVDQENQRTEIPDNFDESEKDGTTERCEKCVRGEIESDGLTSGDNEICQRVKCIENCCQKICDVQSEKCLSEFLKDGTNTSSPDVEMKSQNIDVLSDCDLNHESKVSSKAKKRTSFNIPNNLSSCDTETSGCESSHHKKSALNIAQHRGQRAHDTDSSDIEHVTSSHGEDCQCNRKCLSSGKFTRCPFLKQIDLQGNKPRERRYHTLSESAAACFDLLPTYQDHRYLHLSRTYPSLEGRVAQPNADIETSGITYRLLWYVAKYLGGKWRHLLRTLNVGDLEIEEVNHMFKDHGLMELGYQALITWKRCMGTEATKEGLLKALSDIGLKSVAENCEYFGYQTA